MTSIKDIRDNIKRYKKLITIWEEDWANITEDENSELDSVEDLKIRDCDIWLFRLVDALDKKDRELFEAKKLLKLIGDITRGRDGYVSAEGLGKLIDEVRGYIIDPTTAPINVTELHYQASKVKETDND